MILFTPLLHLLRTAMSELVNTSNDDDGSSQSSGSSNTSQTFSNKNSKETTLPKSSQTSTQKETEDKSDPSSFTKRSAISPRKLLLKLQLADKYAQTDHNEKLSENDLKDKKPEEEEKEEEDENENLYIVSSEFINIMSNATDDPDSISVDMKEVIDAKPNEKTTKLKDKLTELENVTLNMAITGMTGVGKSSFVNALRGLRDDDKDAAFTGTTETTMKPNMYEHPFMPNVKIWDLPGIGSPKFRAKKYLKDVNFHMYDFFFIVTSERFRENDIELAKAIKKSNKLFYFIRTKIDNDVRAESYKRNFDEPMLLDKIREDCKVNLLKVRISKIFLISSFHLERYDFQKLVNTLEEELPKNKRFALIQSLPVYSLEALTKKITYFKKLIWLNAVGAGVGAIAPIPGVSLAVEYVIMKKFFKQVFMAFGLSNQALEVLSGRVNKPVKVLKAAKTSRFKDGITEHILMDMISNPVIAIAVTLGTIMALLPGGALPAGGTAVATVHYLLNVGLREMADDTRKVLAISQLA
ncbi:interferon-gamma-inducible GTPase 10 isoform X2 [Danio rerio]|uniref:Interferon-gamma-inducible GTPase 10 isoform X2 n=1 Tax=Danio rerio TaxID=7955 RepID=A0A8M9NZP7_DANRE|nr:interferon-inducible GTPase 5 isoform X1 [Danio rerio]|eukprot:XP_021322592.1 interferon-inducible GTPase 5 isoform X1 [Danio rerio]